MLRRKEAVADGAAVPALEAAADDADGAAAKFKPGVMFKVGA